MYPGEFEDLFRRVSSIFTLGSIAKKEKIEGKLISRNPQTPLWDTIESIKNCDGIDVGNGSYVECKYFFKKPVRILFFILIHELESRLYRMHKWNGLELKRLDELKINDMIRDLINNKELVQLQDVYSSKASLKEDLKAISSFRNIIVHTNRKLLKSVDKETLIKRKEQILSCLDALQQILDRMQKKNPE